MNHKIDFQKILLGDAIFTLKSLKTNSHYTYRLKRHSGKISFLYLMTSPDNTSSFSYLGIYLPDGELRLGMKSRIEADDPRWLAVKYLFNHPDTPFIDIYHEGRCMKCGKRLTTPKSIELGIGPKCLN